MPTSHSGQINSIVDLIVAVNPKKVLDIGIGHGKYGFLTREYLDISNNQKPYTEREVVIEGIEAFPDYITELQKLIYDKIYVGNALDLIDKTSKYDLILMMDVFEHFTHSEGVKLLQKCLEHSKYVLISCPKHVDPQGAEYGNEFETHKFEWKKKHFSAYPDKSFIPNFYSLICLIGPNAKRIKNKIYWNNLKIKIGSKFPALRKLYIKLKE